MEDIIAIIVLYKLKLKESKTFLSLSAALKHSDLHMDLIVYDNSPSFNVDENFGKFGRWNIFYEADQLNSGVSKAYNWGAERALKLNKKWLLLLDQDTSFPPNTMQTYLSSIEQYRGVKLFAPIMSADNYRIISPCHFKFMRGFSVKEVKTGLNNLKEYSVINCGMLIDIQSFEANKGYNEMIKLDFSDHDFIKRFRKSVTDKFVVIDLKVAHQLSTETKNSAKADEVRLDYYLDGADHMDSDFLEKLLLIVNSLLRVIKLSVRHRKISFVKKLIEHHFKYNGK